MIIESLRIFQALLNNLEIEIKYDTGICQMPRIFINDR